MTNDPIKTDEAGKSTVLPAIVPAKSFMTAGPTLHYSHTNVLWLWFLTVLVFFAACAFWYTIAIGGVVSIDLSEVLDPSLLHLGHYAVMPISIFEHSWQIVVLGTLMGILAVVPVLNSQLLSFRYSIPLVLAVMFIAKLYLFGLFILFSCIAVACRPLRFRSRFISVALCMAPQLIYWAIWGGDKTADPVRWGFSFAPWIYAWLSGLAMAGIVLGIGHFTRYKPGLNGLTCLLFLGIAFGVFQHQIGFAELDYYRYIAGNDPKSAVEFQDQSISDTLDRVLADPSRRSHLEGQLFQFGEPVGVRQRMKERIEESLIYTNRWPGWFRREMPASLRYQNKRQTLMIEYEKFMDHWPGDEKRMPTVMYFRAVLSEIYPDIRDIVDHEMLCFYSDYPFEDNYLNWQELFDRFPESDESIEARWRIAMHHAAKGRFEEAGEYCQMGLVEVKKRLDESVASQAVDPGSFFAAFRQTTPDVITPFRLRDLRFRFRKLQSLLGKENQGADTESRKRLAEFLMLNPYDEHSYTVGLERLLEGMPPEDGLRDNILLAKALQIADLHRRSKLLEELATQYPQRDAGVRAWYEWGMAKIKLWKEPDNSEQEKKDLLAESRAILSDFIEKHPEGPYSDQALEMLQTLFQPQ